MKKHIKKVLCAVALIVLCVTAFVVPSFAYFQTTDQTVLGVSLIDITFWRTDRLAQERDVDVTLQFLYDNSVNDTSSDIWYIANTYTVDGAFNDVTYASYYLYEPQQDQIYSMHINDYKTVTSQRDFEHQFIFKGEFSFSYTLIYYANGGGRDEVSGTWSTIGSYGELALSSLVPSEWDNGVVYWHFDKIAIRDDFNVDVPYYGPYIADAVMQPINAENIQYSTFIDDVPIGEFLWNSVNNFLGTEIFPNVTLYHLFTAIIAIPLFMWFLKLFAGG